MGDKTGIEWTDATWNPVRGCSRVSEGCRNCYAETVAARFSGAGQPYEGLADRSRTGSKWTGKVTLIEHMLDQPLRWKKPRRIFVNSMSDLFHESLSDADIDRVFAVMALAPQHTFQVLTKRPQRMLAYLVARNGMGNAALCHAINRIPYGLGNRHGALEMPLPNVWLGVSVENQATADERIPILLAAPATVRFLSCEPLLGALNLDCLPVSAPDKGVFRTVNALTGEQGHMGPCGPTLTGRLGSRINLAIVGGESGPRARPMQPDWPRGLRDQCKAAGVPFFFKQWGEFLVGEDVMDTDDRTPYRDHIRFQDGDTFYVVSDGHDIVLCNAEDHLGAPKHVWNEYWASGDGSLAKRVGKKAAGSLLDGVEHRAFPT